MSSAKTKRARAKQWYALKKCAQHTGNNIMLLMQKNSKLAYENNKDSYNKAYANDPEKFKKLQKIVTMLILKRRKKHQRNL